MSIYTNEYMDVSTQEKKNVSPNKVDVTKWINKVCQQIREKTK